jgi:putative ABC transport system substrate-binding protein
MRRNISWLVALIFLVAVFPVDAQQSAKMPRIGYVSGSGDAKKPGTNVEAFRQGLRDIGYVDGNNILIEYRYAEGKLDRIPNLVAELLQLKVDVLVSSVFQAIIAAKLATKTIPIVMVTVVDPVETGLIESLAHPGGNVTGLTNLARGLSGKRLELLKEAIPGLSRVGVLWDANAPGAGLGFKEYDTAAHSLKLRLQSLEVRSPNPDFVGAFQVATKERASALVTIRSSIMNRYEIQIAELTIKNRLPSMNEGSPYVAAGGLMSYSANIDESFRRAAVYVDKILKGTKPADLPVEQPMNFEFVINLKTAKQIGVTIPPEVLARANKLIR